MIGNIMWKLLYIISMFNLVFGRYYEYETPPKYHPVSNNHVNEQPMYYSHIPNTITHMYVAPNSYICTCITINTAKNIPSLNATAWDDICSNIQTCTWNKEEIMIKTWYHIN